LKSSKLISKWKKYIDDVLSKNVKNW
jgi:hypothetical protein